MYMLVFVCACTCENLCACAIYLSPYFYVYENYNQGFIDIVKGLGLAQMMRNQRSPHLKNNITSQHYSFIVGKKTNVQWLINHFQPRKLQTQCKLLQTKISTEKLSLCQMAGMGSLRGQASPYHTLSRKLKAFEEQGLKTPRPSTLEELSQIHLLILFPQVGFKAIFSHG